MTDQETNSPTNDDEKTSETVDLSQHDDPAIRRMWEQIQGFLPEHASLRKKIESATPMTEDEVINQATSSEDPEVVTLRKRVDSTKAAYDKAVAALVAHYNTDAPSEDEMAELLKQETFTVAKIRESASLLLMWAENFGLSEVPPVVNALLRDLGAKPAPGTTARRTVARVDHIEVVLGDKTTTVQSFGQLPALLKAGKSYDTYLRAWLASAQAAKWQDVKQPVTFETDGAKLTVYPQA